MTERHRQYTSPRKAQLVTNLIAVYPKQYKERESRGGLKPRWWLGAWSHATPVMMGSFTSEETSPFSSQPARALMLPVLGGNISPDCVTETTDSGAVQTLRALLVGFTWVQCMLFMHWAPPACTTSSCGICPDSVFKYNSRKNSVSLSCSSLLLWH